MDKTFIGNWLLPTTLATVDWDRRTYEQRKVRNRQMLQPCGFSHAMGSTRTWFLRVRKERVPLEPGTPVLPNSPPGGGERKEGRQVRAWHSLQALPSGTVSTLLALGTWLSHLTLPLPVESAFAVSYKCSRPGTDAPVVRQTRERKDRSPVLSLADVEPPKLVCWSEFSPRFYLP